MRTRNYLHEQMARKAGCSKILIDKEICQENCIGNIRCSTTSWNEWSECSVTCGKGMKTRNRRFMNREARKLCNQVDLVEKEICTGPVAECIDVEEIDPKCAVTQWSEWSPCTVTCGKGMKVRTRLYLSSQSLSMCNVELIQKAPCAADKLDCTLDLSEAKGSLMSTVKI